MRWRPGRGNVAEAFVAEGPLSAVVKWNGAVRVAANAGGLRVLDGGKLVSVKPDIKPRSPDLSGNG